MVITSTTTCAVMIAHCLGTLANCDARLEIEDGRVLRFEHHTLAAREASKSLSDRPPAALFELDQVSLGTPEKAPKPPHRLNESS
jgi:hypothetical protein